FSAGSTPAETTWPARNVPFRTRRSPRTSSLPVTTTTARGGTGRLGGTSLVVGVRCSVGGKDAGSVNSKMLLARLRTRHPGEERGPTAQATFRQAGPRRRGRPGHRPRRPEALLPLSLGG